MRKIKFRAWDDYNKVMISPYCELKDGHFWGEDLTNTGYQTPIAVMQFTGLRDDNGNEIYEGDIIKFLSISVDKPVAVEWNDDTCQFQFSDGQPINDADTYGIYKVIIGNIYENPELLNQKEG